mgnify:CR=1 FL=1
MPNYICSACISTESTTPAAPNPTVLQKTHTQPSPWRGLRIIWRDTMPNYVCSRRCPHRANASSTQSYCLAKDPHPTLIFRKRSFKRKQSLERAKNYLVRRHAELCLFALASSPSERQQHPILLPCKRPTPNPLPAFANAHWRGLRIIWRDATRQVTSFKSGPLTELEIVEKLPRLHNW